jgi:uncharacterized protein with GYD domain
MPRYLILFKYSAQGAKGFLKEKASAREAAARNAFESVGGKLEAMYWASGEYTGIAISEFPDAAAGAALSALLDASGAFSHFKSIELLTTSDLDRALAKSMAFRPPGA